MSGTTGELFAFALDLYRLPLRYLPYVAVDRPIPEGFSGLLEALNKRPEHPIWSELESQLRKPAGEIREAGQFLLKRLLFAEGGDHYRVLGLDRSAGAEEIRKRYRLLIALFHPDRNPDQGEWQELYAPKINDAYNALKHVTHDPEERTGRQEAPPNPFQTNGPRRPKSAWDGNGGHSQARENTPYAARPPGAEANPFGDAADAPPRRPAAVAVPVPAANVRRSRTLWGAAAALFLGGLLLGTVIGFRGGSSAREDRLDGLQPSATGYAGESGMAREDNTTAAADLEAALRSGTDTKHSAAQPARGGDRGTSPRTTVTHSAASVESSPPAGGRSPGADGRSVAEASTQERDCQSCTRAKAQPRQSSHDGSLPAPSPAIAETGTTRPSPEHARNDSRSRVRGPEALHRKRAANAPPNQVAEGAAKPGVTRASGVLPGLQAAPATSGTSRPHTDKQPQHTRRVAVVRPVPADSPSPTQRAESTLAPVAAHATRTRNPASPLGPARQATGAGIPPSARSGPDRSRSPPPVATAKSAAAAPIRTPAGKDNRPAARVPATHAPMPSAPATSGMPVLAQGSTTSPEPRSAPTSVAATSISGDRSRIEALIGRFMNAYNSGSLPSFLALFTPGVLSNDGTGREILAKAYGDLFRNSRGRSLKIKDLRWTRLGDKSYRVRFTASISVQRSLLGSADHYAGAVTLRLERNGHSLLISQFQHQVKKQ